MRLTTESPSTPPPPSVAARPRPILQVSTSDVGGGAEKIAWNLHRAYRARGYESWLAVGSSRSSADRVVTIPNDADRGTWARGVIGAANLLRPLVGRVRGAWLARHLLVDYLAEPRRALERARGHEDFAFPATWRLLTLPPERPDILHGHNLHGGYFDLRALPWLSHQLPVVLTLHDAWLLSGHCAHSFECERWRTGCGHCPDLTIYPAVPRDATAENWRRKQAIYARSRLYVATPSAWLADRVRASMLAAATADLRVIPNGVDRTVFRPHDQAAARAELGISHGAPVLLFAANGIRRNIWKDYRTLRAAIARLAAQEPDLPLLLLGLGENSPPERIGEAQVRFVPHQRDPAVVARYYQAADLYVHAARVDTFPTTVIEALACGVPVVATAVGGIPEQVRPLPDERPTGILTPPGDAAAIARAVADLLRDQPLRRRLAANAAADAAQRFDLERQVDTYLSWYGEVRRDWAEQRQATLAAVS
ncbi:MAG TPA: glycosyltransferase [Chloroflexota bacterium]|jgi:glycosyltransferase involved in cell wall biosynthesis|nr:glycosyltransferase [Chloroflexota bacterium]